MWHMQYASPLCDKLLLDMGPQSVQAAGALLLPQASEANADKTVSKFGQQAPPTDKDGVPFTYLESGVSYREYNAGKGEAEVNV